ncbi:unnamed protein product [Paramecium octaurelia]|uniref:Uncharacterized protein n=1 Tax=Paramecium octaurelia TaxID=43137 RepID=A0A8S1S3Q9_PAROT|nr:unnamed protein product [Paramecium octaurelia]
MNLQYQFKSFQQDFSKQSIYNPSCYAYGVYTRYNPLIDMTQLGEIGIFDSNCFFIFNAIDIISNNINFLYYDCVDYQKKQIEKTYTFIGDDGKIYKNSYLLNTFEYESYWYFLGLIVNVFEKRVVITAFQTTQELDTQVYQLKYPNYDTDLQFNIGGSLQININQILFNPQISKLTYFPGNIYYYLPGSISNQIDCEIDIFEIYEPPCRCTLNDIPNFPDSIISKLNEEYFISENLNCDAFIFKTWIRIKDKISNIKEIYYQLIKLSSHFTNQKYLNDNLSAFQLYYKLTESLNQIIITTYSYTFPAINIDFSDNPFLIRETFDIDVNIQLWHFLIVKKDKNSLLVKISFFEGRKIKEYSFESNVNHFNQIRFKVTRGNLLQNINYLTIQLVNMAFYNCDIEITPEPCHISCLECDGPTKFDCISCDSSKNRIYNEILKACVCVYGKIDLDGECKDYSSFELNISQGNEKEFQCSYGYFEFEGECWKCPSIIRERFITCIECITNPKTWINNPYCQYNFVTNNDYSPFTKYDDGIKEYFFDGNDLKVRENSELNLDIYSDYLKTFENFSYFCFYCQGDLLNQKCFIFTFCQQCEIQLSKPICTLCLKPYSDNNGVCDIVHTTQPSNIDIFEIYEPPCRCTLNDIPNFPDSIISKLNEEYFISENLNCDAFIFKTWIRIKDKISNIKEIYYQLIKLSSHFTNQKYLNDNLSAFQLYYKLTESLNQIIITTYSYTFPAINIDFSDNPFLIRETFDIDVNIQLWHFLIVKKDKNSLLVKISFFEGRKIKEYSFESNVNHFNQIRFKVTRGNLLQNINYLTIQLVNMAFYNCDIEITPEPCHISCLECDGPTKFDCISCDSSKNRIYNEILKACVCVYGKIDLDGECKDYSSFELNISQGNEKEFQCSYGYFEFEGECWKCPSIIRERFITCIECITNPKTWINNPYCQYNFVTNNDYSPFTKYDDGIKEYFFDGNDLKVRENSELNLDIYSDYLKTFENFSYFCFYCQGDLLNQKCFIFTFCQQCEIQLSKPICTLCLKPYSDNNGVCDIVHTTQPSNVIFCETPYYQTYYYTCILCPIENCLYCFDYLKDDVKKNTIFYKYSNDGINANDLQVLVGCAQCREGYTFDFTIGQCLYKQPSIYNCLRSFVNQQGEEQCILTSNDDFSIAPQIISCEHYIPHCQQCYQNIQGIVKCIICQQAYTSSYTSGLCESQGAGDYFKSLVTYYDQSIWRYLVQSFTMLFTKINYSYKYSRFYDYVVECFEGYQLFNNNCAKYCDQNCQKCQKQYSTASFTCDLCTFNPYQEPYRVQENGKCIICPSFCLICQLRSIDSIKSINPYYIINEMNTQYTTQCIKSISNSNVQFDQFLQIAKYIYDPNQTAFEYSVTRPCNIGTYEDVLDPSIDAFFENNFDFSYFNEIGLQQFILTVTLQREDYCESVYLQIFNSFQTKVFSIQLLKLRLQGDLSIFQFYQIDNFNSIELNNLLVNIENNLYMQLTNNQKVIDYQILNCSFYSNKNKPIEFGISKNFYRIFKIYNVSIFNANINNQIIFSIDQSTQNEEILIHSFFLIDCIISNTVLFNFNTTSKKHIIIENLLIEGCYLDNFTLINIKLMKEQSKIKIKDVRIKNSIIFNCSILQNYDNNMLYIESLQLIENKILNSQLIKFNKDLFCFHLLLRLNVFKYSIFFEKQYSINNYYEIQLDDFDISFNTFHNFQVIAINQNQIKAIKIELKNIAFQDNNNPIQDYSFILSCSSLLIQNLSILNTFNHRYFYLYNISEISFRNVSVKNELQEFKIPINQDCAINNYQYSKLVSIKGFQSLYLGFIKFTNQITIDQSFIDIQSNDSNINEIFGNIAIQNITIQNITFTRNILMKISQGNYFSMISIYSDKIQSIHLENILYEENSYYQYNEDPKQSSASLLFINSINSSIVLQNIYCFQNSLTNSSNTFIAISSSETKVAQIKVFYHNYLKMEFWSKYYDIQLQSGLNQIEVNYMIEQILQIKNKGGVMQIVANKFTLQNGQFQYLIAKSSSILDIITTGNGIVILNNCSIAYSQINLLSNQEQEGSISIHSQNSFLTLMLQNFNFTEVNNQQAPAIISFEPSEISNNILIKNVQVSNCFSLINLFLSFIFPVEQLDQNQVILENILISQSQEAQLQFNRQLNLLEPIMLSKITQNNAIFNIQGGNLKFYNVKYEGFALSGILNLINCKKIQIVNIQFSQITLFYNLNLLHIEQVAQFKTIIQILNLQVEKISMFNYQHQILTPQSYPIFYIEHSKCQKLKVVPIPISEEDLKVRQNNFELIQSYSTQNGSILYIKSSKNLTKISLQSIYIQNNDCKICNYGLIYFQLVEFLRITIRELQCIGNNIQQFGCITALSDKQIQGMLVIRNSLFINNTGGQGIAVSSTKVKTVLLNIKILNNTATLLGGGLYFDLNNKDFNIISAQIQYNKAREGGGIYLTGEGILSEINFEKSLIRFNRAESTTNNLQELPSHLDLSINNQIMPSDFTFDQISIKQLKLSPYQIIQQGKEIMESKLMILSNQQTAKFDLYDPKKNKFTSYINELSIQFKNRFNEQLLNFSNSTCQIIEQTFDIKKLTKLQSINVSLIQFNSTTSKFDLGMLTFTFDPYNQNDKQYEIQIYCKTKNQVQELSYNIKIKSLLCQLGEFYVLNGCLTCQSMQGFYSVTYNATKCSIFDKNKFEAITSNSINLKPGFWRPHQESDLVNDCFKNVESCKGGWLVGDDICKTGYVGGLCEECDKHNIRGDGYYFKKEQSTCQNCSDFQINIVSLILLTVWVFLSTFITLASVEKTNQLFALFKLTQKFAHILFKMNLNQESILLKLFLNYIWIFSVIFTFNIRFSFSFIFVNQISDTSYFLTSNLDCQLSQSFETELIYARILMMLTLIIIQIFLIQVVVNIISILAIAKLRNNIISITLIYMYIQNYAALINQLFSILAKREISNIEYVQGDVSLLYGSSTHSNWMYKFALPISLLIGLIIPISLLLFLYQNRQLFDKITFRRHIGYLFNEYSVNRSFWEWVKLWKKTIIIVILIYFETNVYFKGFLIGMCLTIYQIITSAYLPYIYPKLNRLDLISGQFCLMAIFLAAVQYLCEQQGDYIQARILSIAIVLICFRFSFPYLHDIISAYYSKYKDKILTLLISILHTLQPKSGLILKLNRKLDQWRQRRSRIEKNVKKLRFHTIQKKRQEKKELQQICIPTLSLNKSGELKFKLLNL